MNNAERIHVIRSRIIAAFNPSHLDVIDDSDQHRGHAGSRDGAGHFTLSLAAESLVGMSRVDAHRKIYAVLADFIPHEIHALQIKLLLCE
jgi:BolA protein